MTILFAPDLQEIVSEELELALKSVIVFSHGGNVLFESVNFALRLLCKMKFEDLDFELHFHVVIETHTAKFVLFDPALHLIKILGIQIGSALEFVKIFSILDSDFHIGRSLISFLDHLGIVADWDWLNVDFVHFCFFLVLAVWLFSCLFNLKYHQPIRI